MKMIFYKKSKKKQEKKQTKNTWKYDILFKCSEKMVFPKKLHWYIIFLISRGKMAFLFPENIEFFYGRKMKDNISQKIHGNMIFSVC